MDVNANTVTIGHCTLEPILVSIEDAAQMIGRSTTFIYACLGDGTLQAVKSNARTLVRSLQPARVRRRLAASQDQAGADPAAATDAPEEDRLAES